MSPVIESVKYESEMLDSFQQYGALANFGRSIPDVRDGLKPAHRSAIWGMWNMNARHFDGRVKSAKAVGEIMGNYHPHGDSAIYGTIVNMTQPHGIVVPLMDGMGNWGTQTDGAASMRYTETRLSLASAAMIGFHPGQEGRSCEVDEDAVPMSPNYDNSRQIPDVLPALFPALVVNGTEGMGVGISTKSPGHNLREVMALAAYLVDQPNPRDETILKMLPGPEIPTGCDIFDTNNDQDGIFSYLKTGYGSYIMRARYHFDEYTTGSGRGKKVNHRIIIDGLPDGTSPEMVIDGIRNMIWEKELPGDIEVADLSKSNLMISIDVHEHDPEDIIHRMLYKGAARRGPMLQVSGSVYLHATMPDHTLGSVGIVDALKFWLDHRRETIRRRSKHRIRKAKARLHIVEGLIKAAPIARDIVEVVQESSNRNEARESIMQRWGFSEIQTNSILDLSISQLTKMGVEQYAREQERLTDSIHDAELLVNNPDELDKHLKAEIRSTSKALGRDRVSNIREGSAYVVPPATPAVEEPTVTTYLAVTGRGFVRKSQSPRINLQMEADHVVQMQRITNKNMVECVTDQGWHSRMPIDEIPSRMTAGKAVFSAFMDPGENPVLIGSGALYDQPDMMVVCGNGQGKRMEFAEWASHKASRPYEISPEYAIKSAFFREEGKDIMIITAFGNALRLRGDELPLKGTRTKTNPYIRLDTNSDGEVWENEGVVWAGTVEPEDTIVYITSDGTAGRFQAKDVRYGSRGSKGTVVTKSDRTISTVALVHPDENGESGRLDMFHSSWGESRVMNVDDISYGAKLTDDQLVAMEGSTRSGFIIW